MGEGAIIDVGWKVKMDQLMQQLEASGQASKKEVKSLVANLTREFKKGEREAEKASKKAGEAWSKNMEKAGKGTEKLFKTLGGPVGAAADTVFDLAESFEGLGAVLGPAAVGAGAAAAGFGLVVAGSISMANAAVEAKDRLQAQGLAALIGDDKLASIVAYERAQKDLRLEVDLLTVSLGAGFAGALSDAAHAAIGTIQATRDLHSAFAPVLEDIATFRSYTDYLSVASWETWALGKAYGWVVSKGDEVVESTKEQAQEVLSLKEREDALMAARVAHGKEEDVHEAKVKKGAAAALATAKAREVALAQVTQQLRDQRDAEADLAAFAVEMQSDRKDEIGAVQQINAEYDKRIASVVALAEAGASVEAAYAAADEAELRRQRDLAKFYKDQSDERKKKAEEEAKDAKDAADKHAEAVTQAWQDAGDSTISILDTIGERLANAAENGTAAQKKAARDFAKFQKAATIANVSLLGVQAIMQAVASAPPPLNVPAIVSAVATTAAQEAAAIAQPIPSFARGGLVADRMGSAPVAGSAPGEVLVQAGPPEGILTGRGVAAAGGRRGIERLNQGQTPAGGGPVTVHLNVDGRRLATAYADPLGSLAGGPPAGRRPLYG